jgi:hypothetical protein
MKTTFNKIAGVILFSAIVLAVSSLFTGCSKDNASVAVSVTYNLSGNASGAQAVPASSNNNGSGNMSGTYNSGTKVMSYTTTWTNLSGAPISGGLYTGAVGEVGTSIAIWSLSSGLSASGTFTTSTTLNADQEAKLLAGKCYYILGTTANASGEIRGQITATAH